MDTNPACCLHTDADLKRMFRELRTMYEGRTARKCKLSIKMKPVKSSSTAAEFVVLDAQQIVAILLHPSIDSPPTCFNLLCSLCHELGHWRSWEKGQRCPKYEEAQRLYKDAPRQANSPLSEAQKHLIYHEESRAWRHGYDFAAEVGFSDESSYVAEAQRALGFYQDGLRPAEPPSPFSLALVYDSA
jgi:hypothetical protein